MRTNLTVVVVSLFLGLSLTAVARTAQKSKDNKGTAQPSNTTTMVKTEGCCNLKTLNYLAPNKADRNERLRQASLIACVEEIKTLLATGADVNAKDNRGETALTLASIQGAVSEAGYRRETSPQGVKCRVETVKLLVENGANSESINTALVNSVTWGRVAVVEFLLTKNMPLEARNRALIAAASAVYNDEQVLILMLDSGATVNAKDQEGNTALMNAARSAKTRLTQILLAKGADINVKDKDGLTPLMHAIAAQGPGNNTKTLSFIQLLLANKANINAKNNRGESVLIFAMRYAQMFQDNSVVDLLKKAGAKE